MTALRLLLLAALPALLAACPACEDICRNDLDCNPDDGKFKCVGNVCQPALEPEHGAGCDDDDGCADGMRCIGDECVFAPSCQFIADGTGLQVLVRDGAATRTTTATASRAAGCAFTLDVAGADGGTTSLDIASIDVDDGAIDSIDCGAGRFTSAGPGGWLTCAGVDYVVGRPGAALCFSDAAPADACAGDAACTAMAGFGATDLGGFCE